MKGFSTRSLRKMRRGRLLAELNDCRKHANAPIAERGPRLRPDVHLEATQPLTA